MSYVTSFVEEGEKRGVDVSIQGLEAYLVTEFSTDRDDWVCGTGSYINSESQRVEILLRDDCWEDRTVLEKENLVYHELGHALLNRRHLNGTLPNEARQKSIMCTRLCSNFNVFLEDGPLREYYLDELFDRNTSFPDSIANKEFKEEIYEEGFEMDEGGYRGISFDGSQINYIVTRGSAIIDGEFEHVIKVISERTATDSIILFKRIPLLDFEPCSNLKIKTKVLTENFDGRVSFGVGLLAIDDTNLGGFSYVQKEYIGEAFGDEVEIEIYALPPKTEFATIVFAIYTNGPGVINFDKIEAEILE